MFKTRNVILAGSSGLVGRQLLTELIQDISVGKILLLNRRPSGVQHAKIEEVITDFSDLHKVEQKFLGFEVLFCCIGTTMKIAGSKEAFMKVDYNIPIQLAESAVRKDVKKFIVISSLGADPKSSNFYLQTKGRMEEKIGALKFFKIAFIRPSMLLGPRKEFRLGEKIGQVLMLLFSFLMIGSLKKYKAISHETVAKAMLCLSHSVNNQRVYESDDLTYLGR